MNVSQRLISGHGEESPSGLASEAVPGVGTRVVLDCLQSVLDGVPAVPLRPRLGLMRFSGAFIGDDVDPLQTGHHAQNLHGYLAALWGRLGNGAGGTLSPAPPDARRATHGGCPRARGATGAAGSALPRPLPYRRQSQLGALVLGQQLGLLADPFLAGELVGHPLDLFALG